METKTLSQREIGRRYAKIIAFKGISLEQKWKERNDSETFQGNKSGGKFMKTVIDYKGHNS